MSGLISTERNDCPTAVADLLADFQDFRERDPVHQANRHLSHLPMLLVQQQSPSQVLAGTSSGDDHGPPSMDPPPATDPAAFVQRLEEMNVEELARAVAAWTHHVDPDMSRRGLLLKLSAGLSLAAADPAVALADPRPPAPPEPGSFASELSGVWHSRYVYYSSSRSQEFEGQHYVVLRQHGSRLVGQSLPQSTDSRLELNLTVDGSIATRRWMERTSPSGHYRGSVYHGTVQLIVNPMGRAMSGKWLGFGNFKVNTGEWELTWMDGSTAGRALRDYHFRA